MPNGKKPTKKAKGNIGRTARQVKTLARSYAYSHVLKGDSRKDILDVLQEYYGYTESYANTVYQWALNLADKKIAMDADKLYQRNLERLESVIEDSVERDNLNALLKAIEQQNKMIGADKMSLSINNGDDGAFIVKLED